MKEIPRFPLKKNFKFSLFFSTNFLIKFNLGWFYFFTYWVFCFCANIEVTTFPKIFKTFYPDFWEKSF